MQIDALKVLLFSVPSFQCFPFCKIMFFLYMLYPGNFLSLDLYLIHKAMIQEVRIFYSSFFNQSYQIYNENKIFFEILALTLVPLWHMERSDVIF